MDGVGRHKQLLVFGVPGISATAVTSSHTRMGGGALGGGLGGVDAAMHADCAMLSFETLGACTNGGAGIPSLLQPLRVRVHEPAPAPPHHPTTPSPHPQTSVTIVTVVAYTLTSSLVTHTELDWRVPEGAIIQIPHAFWQGVRDSNAGSHGAAGRSLSPVGAPGKGVEDVKLVRLWGDAQVLG